MKIWLWGAFSRESMQVKTSFRYRVNVLKLKKKIGKIKLLFILTQKNKSMVLYFKSRRWLSLWLYNDSHQKINKPSNHVHIFIVRSKEGHEKWKSKSMELKVEMNISCKGGRAPNTVK